MKFSVHGKMKLGKEERLFSKEIEAESENAARHTTFALLGSHNGIKRNKIIIEKIEKVG